MEGCSYCQHNCKIKIMNSLNYIMLTTRYLLLLQSFRQEETIIELLLEIKHIMQVGENSIRLGYCALPLGVHCLLFWEHVMASSFQQSLVLFLQLTTGCWRWGAYRVSKAGKITPTEKENIPQKQSSQVHHFKSLKTQVSFKCVHICTSY